MTREVIARRRNCRPIWAESPEGEKVRCFSVAEAARISQKTITTVRRLINGKRTRDGWRYMEERA